jgi:hypothetical protein
MTSKLHFCIVYFIYFLLLKVIHRFYTSVNNDYEINNVLIKFTCFVKALLKYLIIA